ncbi:MAG TPA: transcription repressor NadR [Negativicutes bacterium]|nr:transcription repressor NadR [Negativicutes bacterium]
MVLGSERREAIKNLLSGSEVPVSGTVLAKQFAVSRQVIVQDIAILRAGGMEIIATAQGYFIPDTVKKSTTLKFTVACQHSIEKMEQELEIIVDLGGKILDVVVEHPIYGELRGLLMLNSRRQVKQFVDSTQNAGVEPLSSLTNGVHLHNIEVSDEETKQLVIRELARADILLQE